MIGNLMNSNVVKFRSQDTIKEALKIMNDNKINGAPVVDANDKVIGMIVKADIYRFLMEEGHYDTCPVEWVMTKKVITALEEDDMLNIAKVLRENDIVAIPIVKDGVLKGIVSIEDVVDYIIEKNNKK